MAGNLASNRNEILSLISQAWSEVPALFDRFPSQSEMVITMTDGDGMPDKIGRNAWIRVKVQHTTSEARSISRRRIQNNGIVTVQCFIFRTLTSDDDRVQRVADYIVGILRKHRGNVLFSEAVVQERPINNGFAQCDVVSNFQWDEFVR